MTIFVEISVGESRTDPSPSNSDKKDEQMPNSRIGDTEMKRNLRYLAAEVSKTWSFEVSITVKSHI
jgi:hypothetical protein